MSEDAVSWIESQIGSCTEREQRLIYQARSFFETSGPNESASAQAAQFHTRDKMRALGIAYTPKEVREQIVDTVLKALTSRRDLRQMKFCDPCAGSGLFVLTLLEKLCDHGIPIESALSRNVYFADIDRQSVIISLVNLHQFLIERGISPQKVRANASVSDFFDCDDTFDAYTTNPPYVKLQNMPLEQREMLRKRYPNLFVGSSGLSGMFLKKMLDQTSPHGILGVITQNNFFTSNAAAPLREAVAGHVYHIDTFGPKRIFRDVTAYTCLLYLTASRNRQFNFRTIYQKEDFQSSPSIVFTETLEHSKWRLGSTDQLHDLSAMESRGSALGKACKIWVGIATLCDKAFTVRRCSDGWISVSPNGTRTLIESGSAVPLVKVAELSSENDIPENDRGVIFPYKVTGGKATALSEKEMKQTFPLALKALSHWKEFLAKRDKGAKRSENWFEWGRAQSMIPVPDKLLTKTFSRGPQFFHDPSSSLFSNGYALSPHRPYLIEFVQAVLNSKVFAYYAKLTSFEIEGEYQCYQKNFIERFCLPQIDEAEQTMILESGELEDFLIKHFGLLAFNNLRSDNMQPPVVDQTLLAAIPRKPHKQSEESLSRQAVLSF